MHPVLPRFVAGTALAALLGLPVLAPDPQAAQAGTSRGAGTENRAWVAGAATPKLISRPTYEVTEIRDAGMRVRDNTRLSLNLYLPKGKGCFPCLLIQEGYGKDGPINAAGQARDFARRGYAVVQADIRGMGDSEGHWEPFVDRQHQDGYDLVEWTARQKWCNGKVGTWGTSYMAIDQLLMAKEAPPHLVAMIPVQGWGDAYHGWFYKGGMRSLEDPIVYLGLEQALQALPPGNRNPNVYLDHLTNKTVLSYQRQYMEHPTRDGFWRERSTWREDMHAMARRGLKIMFQDGWNDFFLLPEVTAYEQFREAGGDGMLVLGPWTHGGEGGVLPYDFQTYRVLWFDRWLKGMPNGIDKGPRVLMHVQGADAWRFEKEWPIPDARRTKLYLHADRSGSARSLNDGTLSLGRADTDAAASYVYTPAQVAGGGGLLGAQSPQDQRIDEPGSLTWTTPPLDRPVELSGPITLTFWGSSTAVDTDFVARLVDVAPDGRATQMTRGWLKATHHSSDVHPTPLMPGKVYRFTVTVWPNSNVYRAGHRIRLQLSGSDLPLMEPNQRPARVTVLQDSRHPSALEVDVIGAPPRFQR